MNQRVLLTIGLGLSLAFSSNGNQLKATDTVLAQNSSRAESLTVEILKNASYKLPRYGQITLTNGAYQSQTTPSLSVKMSDKIALGDFNRDGVADAATILKVMQGNAKPSFYLAVVVEQKGAANNVDTISLEQATAVKTLSIKQGAIVTVKMLKYAPNDVPCCPSEELTQSYRLNPIAGKLIPTSLNVQNPNTNGLEVRDVPAPYIGDNFPDQSPEGEIELKF